MSQNNGHNTNLRLKTGLAEMLKGGVIMDVTDAKQAEIAQRAGAVAVMALERVPAQIRAACSQDLWTADARVGTGALARPSRARLGSCLRHPNSGLAILPGVPRIADGL